MIVSIADEALEDLSSSRVRLAERNPQTADRIGRRLVEVADSLATSPIAVSPASWMARARI
jgi:plasmid stabilization system protein ParE